MYFLLTVNQLVVGAVEINLYFKGSAYYFVPKAGLEPAHPLVKWWATLESNRTEHFSLSFDPFLRRYLATETSTLSIPA